MMGLLPPNASVGGEVRVDGTDILAGGEDSVRPHRWTRPGHGVPGRDERAEPGEHDRRQIAEPIMLHGVAPAPRRASGPASCSSWSGSRPRPATVPARVLRRDAAAGRDRDGAGLRAEGAAGRRADHRARRHGAGADHGPARPAVRGTRSRARARHPRPARGRAGLPAGRRDVRRARSSRRARRTRCSTRPGTPTPGCCSPPRPTCTPTSDVTSIPGAPPRLDEPVTGCPFLPRCDSVVAGAPTSGRAPRRSGPPTGPPAIFTPAPPRRRGDAVTSEGILLDVADLRTRYPVGAG